MPTNKVTNDRRSRGLCVNCVKPNDTAGSLCSVCRTRKRLRRKGKASRVAMEQLRMKKRYARGSAFIDEFKLRAGCTDCGYRAHPAALQFDHLPGKGKLRNLAMLRHRSLKVIQAEMAKCEVVCANCHAIRTSERRAKQQPC